MFKITFAEFFNLVKEASFTPSELASAFGEFLNNMHNDPDLFGIWEKIWGAIHVITPAVPFILLALFGVVGLFGKRIWSVLRCILYFLAGFILGTHLLGPLVVGIIPSMPPWVVGLVVAVVAAVLSKILHWVVLAVTVEYIFYYFFCGAHILRFITQYTEKQYILSLVLSAGFVVLMFFFLKYVEMALTSFAGSFGIAMVINHWVGFSSMEAFDGFPYLMVLIIAGILAVGCMIVQVKTRKRYD